MSVLLDKPARLPKQDCLQSVLSASYAVRISVALILIKSVLIEIRKLILFALAVGKAYE